MGRHQYVGGHTARVSVRQDPSTRKAFYNQHDDRELRPPSSSRGRGGGGGRGRGRGNRVWDKNGRHVSFNDRGGFAGRGVRKRGGSNSRGRGGGNSYFRSAVRLMDGDDGEGDRRAGVQAGLARPIAGSIRSKYGRGGVVVRRRGDFIQLGSDGGSGWHRVVLANASRYPKEEVLGALVAAHPTVAPLAFAKQGMNYSFHVETRQQAAALNDLDRKVMLPGDGTTLGIRAEPSAPPHMTIDDEAIDRMKRVMSSRYVASNKALNLKQFHCDKGFLGESVYAPLYRGICMKRVAQIVAENIPELEAIDVSNNGLSNLETFSALVAKVKNVRVLYLAQNKLGDIKELTRLKDWKLLDLNLDGNPLVNNYKDYDHFVSSVRRIFPSLKRMDGKDLPKVIGFEGDEDGAGGSGGSDALPGPVMKMVCNPAAENTILQFLQEYFKIYDSGSREALMSAYHEEAQMSLSCEYQRAGPHLTGAERLNEYTTRSRNLYRISDPTRRKAALKQGRLAVVSFLNELPRSRHDLASFSLDVPLATEAIITFSITGIFKEEGHPGNQEVFRHFSRTFVVVPQNGGFCIVNEVLFVTSATSFQSGNAFKDSGLSSSSTSAVPQVNPNAMQTMVEALSSKTGMNTEWSKKCLEQTQWSLDHAYDAFHKARDEGKIPIEAYEK